MNLRYSLFLWITVLKSDGEGPESGVNQGRLHLSLFFRQRNISLKQRDVVWVDGRFRC